MIAGAVDHSDRPAEVAPGETPPRRRRAYSKLSEATDDTAARRLCAVILEVLGGARTPTDAAEVLGISAARYYALEARALRGLLKACQRRSKGRRRSAESEVLYIRKELRRVESERDRLGALLRASQRTLGIAAASKAPAHKATATRDGAKPVPGKRRAHRAKVRALRAARSLEASSAVSSVASGAASAPGSSSIAGQPVAAKKSLEAASLRRENAPGVKA